MRIAMLTVVLLATAGAAHAQFTPYKPIEPPRNPYALPQQPAMPHPQSGFAPIRPVEPPRSEGAAPFKPYKPWTGINPDETPSGLYPELHKHRKPKAVGGF
jgi:hypothetical protein